MKKALILTSVAFVLLLAVVAAGLNVIFTITYIEASFSTFSAQGEEDAYSLKAELDEFVGDSMTFLKLGSVKAKVEKYPCFRVESVTKKFPKTVQICVSERRELFAYQTQEGKYAMIDTEGVCIRMSEQNVSRTGGENILLKNFELETEVGSKIKGTYLDALFDAFSGFEDCMTDARANVREVTLAYNGGAGSLEFNVFNIEMQEGVIVEMYDPLTRAAEKAKVAMEKYSGLGDIQKMYGTITVTESRTGELNVVYQER